MVAGVTGGHGALVPLHVVEGRHQEPEHAQILTQPTEELIVLGTAANLVSAITNLVQHLLPELTSTCVISFLFILFDTCIVISPLQDILTKVIEYKIQILYEQFELDTDMSHFFD